MWLTLNRRLVETADYILIDYPVLGFEYQIVVKLSEVIDTIVLCFLFEGVDSNGHLIRHSVEFIEVFQVRELK